MRRQTWSCLPRLAQLRSIVHLVWQSTDFSICICLVETTLLSVLHLTLIPRWRKERKGNGKIASSVKRRWEFFFQYWTCLSETSDASSCSLKTYRRLKYLFGACSNQKDAHNSRDSLIEQSYITQTSHFTRQPVTEDIFSPMHHSGFGFTLSFSLSTKDAIYLNKYQNNSSPFLRTQHSSIISFESIYQLS